MDVRNRPPSEECYFPDKALLLSLCTTATNTLNTPNTNTDTNTDGGGGGGGVTTRRRGRRAGCCGLGRGESVIVGAGLTARPIRPAEIRALKANGNYCDDDVEWRGVWVWSKAANADDDTLAPRGIMNCRFLLLNASSSSSPSPEEGGRVGVVLLPGGVSAFDGNTVSLQPMANVPAVRHPGGLWNSTFTGGCFVDRGALIKDTGLLSDCIVGEGAAVVGCGVISTASFTSGSIFGNGASLALGPQTGCRGTVIWDGMTLESAAAIASERRGGDGFAGRHADAARRYAARKLAAVGGGEGEGEGVGVGGKLVNALAPRSQCLHCPSLASVSVGVGAVVANSEALNSTLLDGASVRGGAVLRDSILQAGARVADGALCERSLVCRGACVGARATVRESVVGPLSIVEAGECDNSLVGTQVAMHHQSLLIASVWPGGRGNVGYGANVGSNHTGRAPDQELWPGEGIFFGLGCVVKFPGNYVESPYSIVAAGVQCLPQVVRFPFSLINSPSTAQAEFSPAINELIPAWVLSDSPFTVERNERKFRARADDAAAVFSGDAETLRRLRRPIMRPEIVGMMVDARDRLQAAAGSGFSLSSVYTRKEVDGLGHNYMTERSRQKAVSAYTTHIRRYILRGLLAKAVQQLNGRRRAADDDAEAAWEHQRELLRSECNFVFREECSSSSSSDRERVCALLQELVEIDGSVVEAVASCKARDDVRGARVIPGYGDAHPPAEAHAVVIASRAAHAELRATVDAVTRHLSSSASSSRYRHLAPPPSLPISPSKL